MKLSKAIEILTEHVKISKLDFLPDVRDATLLGIEAGKTILSLRHYPFPDGVIRLPGETPEDD